MIEFQENTKSRQNMPRSIFIASYTNKPEKAFWNYDIGNKLIKVDNYIRFEAIQIDSVNKIWYNLLRVLSIQSHLGKFLELNEF